MSGVISQTGNGGFRSATNYQFQVLPICILQILNRIELKPTIKIYIKRLHGNQWRDGRDLDYTVDVEDIMSDRKINNQEFEYGVANIENRKPKIFSSRDENMIDETIRYHHTYKPDKTADFTLLRNDLTC
ncbi:MAG: hypothetical protein KAQ72_10480 [Desulfobacula sp.]|nr:hypothetical protein [Desulfobacula sp.]